MRDRKSRQTYSVHRRSIGLLYLFLAPATVLVLLFQYLPMFSNYIAFLKYDFSSGWMGLASPFVGLKNFAFVLTPSFWKLAGRTVLYSSCLIAFSFPAPLVLALLLNELRSASFKRFVQTVSYIPHFVSWVTVSGLFYLFLTADQSGLVNNIVESLGGKRVSYMQQSRLFLPIVVISQIWKELGWGTILYLAAITNIDPQLYEAAEVDGASRLRRAMHITLPGLVPTTSILLILTLGGLFTSNFDQIFNLQNPVIRNETDTINVFIYYRGILNQQYAFAAAVGLFQGVISFVLVMTTNLVTKRLSETGII